jgi:peptidoglycan/LPS O-acetylase OafA/YrhL
VKLLRWSHAIAVVIGVIAIRVALEWASPVQSSGAASLPHRMLMTISVPICMGSLLALLFDHPRTFEFLYSIIGRKWSAPAACILLLACLVPSWHTSELFTWIVLPLFVGACVIREDHGLSKILRIRPLAFIGVISYGMYLLNTLAVKAVQLVAGRLGITHPVLMLPFTLGLSILVSWLSFRYFESAFLALKVRFSRLHPAPAEVASKHAQQIHS